MPCPTCRNPNGGITLWKCDAFGHVRCNSVECSKIAKSSTYGENARRTMCGKGTMKKIK